jgi:ribonuclease HI
VTPEFIAYVDGASRKDGRGGWGCAIWFDECWWDDCGGDFDTTNNRMELMGAIAALDQLQSLASPKERLSIRIISDSQYVIKGITEYIDDWRFRLWRTSGNKPVKNRDLWERLYIISKRHDIEWQWVKGHTGDIGNERADRLAAQGVPQPREEERDTPPARVPLRRRTTGRGSPHGPIQDRGGR